MATTEQRSGFRLPWASEPSSDAAPAARPSPVAAPTARSVTEATQAEAATSSTGSRDLPWPSSDTSHPTAVEAPSDGDAADPEGHAAEPVAVGTATEAAAGGTHGNGSTGDGSIDAGMAAADVPGDQLPAANPKRGGPPGHVNPLVAGLLKVMRDAAEAARQESLAAFVELAKARAEEIRAESSGTSAEMRRVSDVEIAAIREWTKAQMVRIRQEADDRIADRRRRLEIESEEHAARIERRIERVRGAVGTYETQMATFFESLRAEDDPAGLAGFAALMPEPPDLRTEEIENDDNDGAPSRTLDPDAAAAAEAAALLDLDIGDASDSDEAGASVQEPDPKAAAETTGPAADAGVDTSSVTIVSVVGLVSVASITGFKRAVGRAAGVGVVSVASGPSGDFEFTVRHAESIDLAKVVGALDGFTTTVTTHEKGVLSVTASETPATN